MYKLHGYGKYKMKGGVISAPKNNYQTQQMLPCLPYDEVTIGVFFK
jgi:hypothetical protein